MKLTVPVGTLADGDTVAVNVIAFCTNTGFAEDTRDTEGVICVTVSVAVPLAAA
jgi:hypothetical protein